MSIQTCNIRDHEPYDASLRWHRPVKWMTNLRRRGLASSTAQASLTRSSRSVYCVILLAAYLFTIHGAEARSNSYCAYEPWYSGKSISCGGHLQPGCNSPPTCDAGHNAYTGAGLPTISCPDIRDPVFGTLILEGYDIKITSGCYDQIPTCNACGAAGQPPCPSVAEPVCGGCDDGLVQNPVTTLCQQPDQPGASCDVFTGCTAGLSCDPILGRCEAQGQVGDACFGQFETCADGLQCTLALQCSSQPAQVGETCDVTAPCADGLYCQPGVPQRCIERKKPGETCNPFSPCVAGATCIFDPTGGYSQCFPDGNDGPITAQRCETFYSSSVDLASPENATRTLSSGNGKAAFVAESQAYGVAYGQEGSFGCFNATCKGYDADVSIEAFIAEGQYDDYESVGGNSFSLVVEGQLPGSVANASYTTVYGDEFLGEVIGSEIAVGIGIGLSPLPGTLGDYACETELITIFGGSGGNPQPPPPGSFGLPGPAPAPPVNFGALQFDGTDDMLTLSDPSALQFDAAVTLEAWIQPQSVEQDATLVSKAGEYWLGLANGELVYMLATSSPGWPSTVATGVQPKLNEWVHVALVYDASTQRAEVYVNAELRSVQDAAGAIVDALPGDDAFSVGGAAPGTASFNGQIDSLRIWSRALDRLEIYAGLNTGRSADDPGLAAAWRFDEYSGDELTDEGPAQLHLDLSALGTSSAPARVVDGRNIVGGSANFDGVQDYAAVEIPELLDALVVTSALTMEAWIYPTGPGSDPTYGGLILNKEGEYALGRMPDGRLYYAIDNSIPNWSTQVTAVVAPENEWTHLALTYDSAAGQIKVYRNGSLEETQAGNGLIGDHHTAQNELRFGRRQINEAQKFEGLIDELRIWKVARSETDMSADYAAVVAPDSPGLLGYWRFDEGPVAMAFDSSGAARHAYLGGGAPLLSPSRVGTAGMDYPPTLLQPACGGAACPLDTDGDGSSNYTDNCLLVANADQADGDSDGYGNRCDADFDNSGVVNFADLALFKSGLFTSDPELDLDNSGVVNFVDLGILKSLFFVQPGPSARVD